MDETLLLKCAKLKTLRLPDDPTDDYDLEVKTPIKKFVTDDNAWYADEYNSYIINQLLCDEDFFGEPIPPTSIPFGEHGLRL
jgi:hypothetical protein